ncbi:hypothetical protein HLRTI_002201 [Halorhabdus tiamatea SARL4B]|uniref:Conserved hypothetical membrane protein (DUF4129) n=1 Tax=Halorhabdus tiamatea SARL4B TaxID=1033806 RepID=F7PJI7_9EURY|nr:DUF4129 domain-containing protein [Halorhabdus tiamatea]ERJ05808.1 hypothetical protein HLRTI_002201 [Halorhabdus tiamatea SARL4B]CCQ34257.1 conserved hypothetical membrane protein (DUF4129) [Halorhabdus tiamatea SARL4B]
MQLDRRTVGVVVVGVLGALALTFAAGTLANPAAQGSGSLVSEDGDSSAVFQADDALEPDPQPLPELGPVLQTALLGLLGLTFVVALYVLSIRDLLSVVLAVLTAGIGFWLLMELIIALTGPGSDVGFGQDAGAGPPGGADGIAPEVGVSTPPSAFLLGIIAVVAVLALVVLFGLSTDEGPSEPDADVADDATPETLTPIGAAAGRAAAEIQDETTSTSNAVYRAWVDMTDALDVPNRAATTPGEFADVAIEAGMAPRDVEELTRLFEDVRYGDAPVSAARERQATDALRRIESTYAGDES